MAWNKKDAHPVGDGITWEQHPYQKDVMCPRWESNGNWGCASFARPRMMGPDHKHRNKYGSGKGKYQCAVCGKRFGSYANIGYYTSMDAWAHMGCIVRDMAKEEQ